jgi:hypothetical protein
MVVAAAVTADADAATEPSSPDVDSSSIPQQQQQQQQGATGSLHQRYSSSSSGGWSHYSSSSSRSSYQVRRVSSQTWLKVSNNSMDAISSSGSLQGTATLDSIESPLSSVEDAGTPAVLPGSSSSSRRLAGNVTYRNNTSNVTSGRAPAGADDADWLTAVLSVSTSKLSVHSNAVLTNSLKRLASLRLTGGSSSAAAAAAAAVEGPEGLVGLLESVRARFASFGLQHFEEVALQLGQLGYEPDEEWLASFERCVTTAMTVTIFA